MVKTQRPNHTKGSPANALPPTLKHRAVRLSATLVITIVVFFPSLNAGFVLFDGFRGLPFNTLIREQFAVCLMLYLPCACFLLMSTTPGRLYTDVATRLK